MKTVNQNSTDWSIRFFAYDADQAAVTGLTHASAGMSVSVVVRSKGRIVSTTPLTLVARSGAGVHTDNAIAEVGAGEYCVDLADSYLATADREISLTVAATAITGWVAVEQLSVVAPVMLQAGYTAPLDAAGVRAAIGMSAANLDTQLNNLGDADQDTLLAVQETVDDLAAALVGAESIALTGPVTGTDISIVIDSDYRQRSGTELPIPVDDSTGALSTRLNALGLDSLSFGAAREGKAAGEITGTVYSVTNAAGVTTIRVEISNAGSGLSPGEYAWQLQASHTQGDEVDNEIVISGNLILERRTVAPL